LSWRRAISTNQLEATRMRVLAQRIFGLGALTQSVAMLRLIRKAATKERKTTELETSSR
jgi:hypothetical protein